MQTSLIGERLRREFGHARNDQASREGAMPEQPRPSPPTFATLDEERTYRKQHLAAALRVFSRFGWGEGTAGHITARDPERTDCFWVNPYGRHFGLVKVSDLILVDASGTVVEGSRPVNAAAFAIHASVHEARPDVVAAAHAHSMYGKSWSSLGRLLDPITQDVCSFYNDHVLFDSFTGVVLDKAEGERIAKTLGDAKAMILQNHGLLTVGQSVDEAAWWFIKMERSCEAQLHAEAAGTPIKIAPEVAELTRNQSGTHKAGWFTFQPLYEWICEEEPNLLD
jgi:ribulose-5-phosphate 4-epimerase/fuculose-1-phosphate aldolase